MSAEIAQPSGEGTVSCDVSGAVATITLRRPDRLNALSGHMRAAFGRALDEVEAADGVRVVLIRGEGRAFCAGGDLDSFPSTAFGWRARLRIAQDHHARMVRSDLIFVAAVQGAAAGGGASLALASDILVMAEGAKIVFPFVRLGLVPDGGASVLLTAKLGPALAADLLLSGGTMTAAEAKQAGLTRRVVPDADLADAAETLAADLAAMPDGALALTKNLMRGAWADRMQASFDHEVDAMALAAGLPGHAAALAAATKKGR
ncbi:enoyl-CoA hydratase [Oceanicola sp. 22II-s10i]|uniref:enoyl-CoA hydratase/isomerase family protein n=1 Tax=Oceanicola sp. 22II-s10i TaxID=1317116 RepID=UPI000B528DDA|nr:enoyl-CoA hydratase/isomerase family protein [Oceanicola sp. 22II-s10i]OWU85865.1 enoyl-CoA hydratase [Oceanicola sp. 22II-s10i]